MRFWNLRSLGGRKPMSPEERFAESFVPEPNSGCWLWLGSKRSQNGYGRIKAGGRTVPAHRYAWELFRGPIPDGMIVCHKCDVPPCVNPNHLFVGTHKDNAADRDTKGRAGKTGAKNPRRGTDNHAAKLSPALVRKIRRDKRPQYVIAEEYGMSQAAIWAVKARVTWRQVA